MTNLNLYKFFCVVAKEKNLSKASEKLFVSQPAVSFSIKELEKELGQKLFVRKSKGVELTTFGKMLYEKISPFLSSCDEAEILAQKFAKLQTGVVRIGSSSSNVNQVLIDYLSKFASLYPDIQIVMERGSKDELVQKLSLGELDMIFVDKFDKVLDYKIVKQIDVVYQLIGSKEFKQKYSVDSVEPKDFPVQDLMLPSINNNSRITINNYFNSHGISLNPKYELDNYILLYEFVKKGFGMAFVNIEYYKQKVLSHEVEVIFPNFSICARNIVCAVSHDISNPATNKLVEIITNN